MKNIFILFVSICIVLSLTSCASDNGVQLYYDYDLSEYISVGDFSKTVDRNSVDYKKYYREFYFDAFGEDLAETLSVGKVQEGDKVNINYYGTLDGKEFDGGTELNYTLRIGDGLFIVEGFEQNIIGASLGEEVTLTDLTLPENYHNKELAGKKVSYIVQVNAITRYPEPDNTQAIEYGFESLDDYRRLADEFAVGVTVFNSAYDAAEIKDFPEKETEMLFSALYQDYADTYAEMGSSVEAYVASVDWTMDMFYDHLYDSLKYDFRRMPRDLLSYYLLGLYDRKLSRDDFNGTCDRLKSQYGQKEFEKISDIELETIAVYEKALRVCFEIAEVK